MYNILSAPFSNTGDHHGVISRLNKAYNIDVLTKKYINVSSSPKHDGEIETVVNHGTGYYRSKSDGTSTYIQISFLKGNIFPIGYTLKGNSGGWCFAKSWYVYGIRKGYEDKEDKWEILGENDSTQSTFCQKLNAGGYCDDDRVGYYSMKPINESLGFKHLRWKLKEVSVSCMHVFLTAGIDVYGILLLNDGNKRKSVCRCRINNILLVALFVNNIHHK